MRFYFILFSFSTTVSLAQLNIDSVKQTLANEPDSVKLTEYYNLFWQYESRDINTASSLTTLLCSIAENSDYKYAKSMAIDARLNLAYNKRDYKEAYKAIHQLRDVNLEVGNELAWGSYYQQLGIYHYYQSRYDSAAAYFEKAAEERKRLGEMDYYARTIVNIGSVYHGIEDYENALKYFLKGYDLFKEGHGKSDAFFMVAINISNVLLSINRYNEMLIYIDQANAIAEQEDAVVMKAQVNYLYGMYYQNMKEHSKAIPYFELSISQNESQQIPNTKSYLALGKCYTFLDEFIEAERYLLSAIDAAELEQNADSKVDIYIALAELCQEQGKNCALNYFEKALDINTEVKITGVRLLHIYRNLLFESVKNKDLAKGEKYLESYYNLNDSLDVLATNARVQEIERKFNNKEQEFKLQKLESDAVILKAEQRSTRWMVGALSLLVVVVVLVGLQRIVSLRANKKMLLMNLEQQKLKNELDLHKSKNLALLNMQYKSDKESLLEELRLKAEQDDGVQQRYNQAKLSDLQTQSWETFMDIFSNSNPSFINSLFDEFPNLSQIDIKHCVLIKSRVDVKEAARLLNNTERGVYTARYRLKKKLDLDKSQDLNKWLVARV